MSQGRPPYAGLRARWQKPPSYRARSPATSPGGRPPYPPMPYRRQPAAHSDRPAGAVARRTHPFRTVLGQGAGTGARHFRTGRRGDPARGELLDETPRPARAMSARILPAVDAVRLAGMVERLVRVAKRAAR